MAAICPPYLRWVAESEQYRRPAASERPSPSGWAPRKRVGERAVGRPAACTPLTVAAPSPSTHTARGAAAGPPWRANRRRGAAAAAATARGAARASPLARRWSGRWRPPRPPLWPPEFRRAAARRRAATRRRHGPSRRDRRRPRRRPDVRALRRRVSGSAVAARARGATWGRRCLSAHKRRLWGLPPAVGGAAATASAAAAGFAVAGRRAGRSPSSLINGGGTVRPPGRRRRGAGAACAGGWWTRRPPRQSRRGPAEYEGVRLGRLVGSSTGGPDGAASPKKGALRRRRVDARAAREAGCAVSGRTAVEPSRSCPKITSSAVDSSCGSRGLGGSAAARRPRQRPDRRRHQHQRRPTRSWTPPSRLASAGG